MKRTRMRMRIEFSTVNVQNESWHPVPFHSCITDAKTCCTLPNDGWW